jgi:rSAM/selenodomain-associated transferase 1
VSSPYHPEARIGNLSIAANPRRITLGLMTKYWDIGKVKTRLGKSIGMRRAASLHRLFLMHLCESLAAFDARREVCLSPSSRAEELIIELKQHGLENSWQVVPQADGDLGHRIAQWFDATFPAQFDPVQALLIGADCPTLSIGLIAEASDRLASHDVVLGPALDGGYYLIGISAPWRQSRFLPLFDRIAWSTEKVLGQTRQRLAETGLSWYELETREDVDTLTELNRLRRQLLTSSSDGKRSAEDEASQQLLRSIDEIMNDDFDSANPSRCHG